MQLDLLTWIRAAPQPTGGRTDQSDARLIKMYRESDVPDIAEIARVLGKTYTAVASHASRLGLTSRSATAKMRRCLGDDCGRHFMSESPSNRICDNCSRSELFRCAS